MKTVIDKACFVRKEKFLNQRNKAHFNKHIYVPTKVVYVEWSGDESDAPSPLSISSSTAVVNVTVLYLASDIKQINNEIIMQA